MSGGVDSAVAAVLLKKQGHNLTGVTMRLTDDTDVSEAEQAAASLHIPHEVVDMRTRFRAVVVDAFARSYRAGLTPNPCVVCNFEIKFGALLDYALSKGADKLATGHYARLGSSEEGGESRKTLLKGLDPKKDQSYFLYRLQQNQLQHLAFPLGELTKDAVQAMAVDLGLPQANREESQDICFIPGGDCGRFMAEVPGGRAEPGEIVDEAGRVLGSHDGICAFTVGQRKGLGLGGSAGSNGDTEPLYVLAIEAKTRQVVVGPRDHGYRDEIDIANVSWVSGIAPAGTFNASAKIRYNTTAVPGTVKPSGSGLYTAAFATPVFAPAPGQSVVFYDGDEVLGGGIISGSR